MKGVDVNDAYLVSGKAVNGTQALPSVSLPRLYEARMKESLFRNYASVASVKTDVAVFAEEFHSKAEWIPEN